MAQASATPIDSSPVSDSTVQNDPILTLAPEDIPDVEHLITEDDTPVDMFAEKQQRLLTGALYDSWQGPGNSRPFLAASNVGIFYSIHQPPLVPDVFLSLDVKLPEDLWAKQGRSYFTWTYGKPPDVVIEVVCNTLEGEIDTKMERYAWFGVPYYVIFDPIEQVQKGVLRAYELMPRRTYIELSPHILPGTGLGLQIWQGVFERREAPWLRWQDASGALILLGEERAEQARERAEQARERAQQARERAQQARERTEQERTRAQQARERAQQARERAQQAEEQAEQERTRAQQAEAERLAALLRAHGISPESDDDAP